MPELPEVETFKRYFDSTSLHQRIVGVDVQNAYVLKGISARELAGKLKGRRFKSSRRHGKHLFVGAGRGLWLRLHFGMTGSLEYLNPDQQTPPYARVLFRFEKNCRLVFDDPRQFGEISLLKNVDDYLTARAIGPDALKISFSRFKQALPRRGAVKAVLLNQKLISGIGNLYADEILFRARIHPATQISVVEGNSIVKLFRATRHVLETAVRAKADWDRTPKSWLLPHRGKGGKCPRCHRELETAIIGGRTAWFCAQCQKRI